MSEIASELQKERSSLEAQLSELKVQIHQQCFIHVCVYLCKFVLEGLLCVIDRWSCVR